MRKTILALAAATLLGAGCATQTAKPADAGQAAAAIAAAEASRAAAAAVGYEWRDTAKMIEDAKKAVEEKDFDKAVKLAKQAEKQGKNAVAQHQQQVEAVKGK
jgi:hypothetical protein